MNATVTSAAAAPRIQNIETLNVTGRFATAGIDLASTTGVDTLNINTSIQSGTGTVTNAASLNAASIVFGANVNTVNVTATASGTRDEVTVDAASAATVNITGGAGTDIFDVSVADGASVTLAIGAGTANIDTYKLNTTGGDVTIGGAAAADTVEINNTAAALTATLTTGQTVVGTGAGSTFSMTGSADVTLVSATSADITGQELVNTGSGTVTLQLTDTAVAATADFTDFAVDTLELSGTGTDVIVIDVNEATTVQLTGDVTADDAVTLDVGNTDGTFTAGEGELRVIVSEALTKAVGKTGLTTDAGVGTLILSAQADEAADTDTDSNGTDETVLTVAQVVLAAKTTVLALTGSEDLTISLITTGAASTISAADMTGNLTITDTAGAFDSTIVLGSGDDTVSDTVDGQAAGVYGNAGDDTITTGTGNDSIYGGDGDDVLAGAAGTNLINGGAGADTITSAGTTDTLTLGAGADVVRGAIAAGYTVTDFNVAEDTIVVTGSAAASVDLTDVTPTTGAYNIDGQGTTDFTLTGITETDLSTFVQLGRSGAAFTAFASATVVAGDKGDYINVATTKSATITTGAGSDVVVLNAGAASAVTINDFTVGTDKVIYTGLVTADTAINLHSITPATGAYTLDALGVVTLSSGGTAFTATDLSGVVQLGLSATDAYDIGITTGALAIRGSDFNDFIDLTKGAHAVTYSFDNDGGMDTLVAFTTGTDIVSFDNITGITATAGTATTGTTKIADAVSGAVYVFGNATTARVAGNSVSTFTENEANGITADVILADVASFLEANLTEANGETYVAIMTNGTNSYAYLVNADADGIDAADISLIGTFNAALLVVADVA